MEDEPGSLLYLLLSNHVVLSHLLPFLPPLDVLNLAATSRAYRTLFHQTRSLFRYLDLSGLVIRDGESVGRHQLPEDEDCSAPLRHVFRALDRPGWLQQVHTLVLDGTAVTATFVHELLTGPHLRVRILSLRRARHLNEYALQGALRTACRPSRPPGSPNVQAIYLFGESDEHADTSDSDIWYRKRGRVLPPPTAASSSALVRDAWADTLVGCRGAMAFDAVLCNGPRHFNSPVFGRYSTETASSPSSPSSSGRAHALATYALDGCAGCGSAPEGWSVWPSGRGGAGEGYISSGLGGGFSSSESLSQFPLLWPPPRFSSSARAAQCPDVSTLAAAAAGDPGGDGGGGSLRFIARCDACLKDRFCFGCLRWWCEACVPAYTMLPPAAVRAAAIKAAAAAAAAAASSSPSLSSSPSASSLSASSLSASSLSASPRLLASSPSAASSFADSPLAASLCHSQVLIERSCFECGPNCFECIAKRQLKCKRCRNDYCTEHNVGSSLTHCDWCCAPTYRYSQQRV